MAVRLHASGAGVCLLSELDDGMARTDNEDIADAIATDIGAGYAFGVEFVELGLGDDAEQRAAAGRANERGLHGNAIVSPAHLGDPVVVRLPGSGAGWFAADSPQPRVGGRIAVLATVDLDGVPVELASVHLENRTDARHRAEQMEVLLQALDERSDGGPAVVGGDFNTLGVSYADLLDRPLVRRLRQEEPTRFTWPVAARAPLRGGTGARIRVDRRERRRAHHRARRRRVARPRAAEAGLDPRARVGGPAPGRDPGQWPVGPPRRLGRCTTPDAMTVTIRPAGPDDAAGILAVVEDAFSYGGTRDAGEELAIVAAHLVGAKRPTAD